MTISTPSRNRKANTLRAPAMIGLLAGGLLAACSLLAPSDAHYLSDPSRASGASGEGGANGEGGEAGQVRGEGGEGGDTAGGTMNPSAGEGGSSGAETGGESGSDAGVGPPVCKADFADCNEKPGDGCEADLNSSNADCGRCGNPCAEDEQCEHKKCVSVSGCSDGVREGFFPESDWPYIAGCAAKWPRSSLREPATGIACGYDLGVDCVVPADACGTGWHVCASPPYGPAEVSSQASVDECATQPGAYAIAVGDQICEPCSKNGAGAACCGAGCVQQNGSCIYPGMTAWFGVIDNYTNLCGAIESSYLERGVLCCRAP